VGPPFRWGRSHIWAPVLWTRPARRLCIFRLNEKTITTNLFTAAPLTYNRAFGPNLAELWVITNASGDLRQIRAPQALVEHSGHQSAQRSKCALKFYLLSQRGHHDQMGPASPNQRRQSLRWT